MHAHACTRTLTLAWNKPPQVRRDVTLRTVRGGQLATALGWLYTVAFVMGYPAVF